MFGSCDFRGQFAGGLECLVLNDDWPVLFELLVLYWNVRYLPIVSVLAFCFVLFF